MLGAAMFNARKPEQYFIARDCLGELVSSSLQGRVLGKADFDSAAAVPPPELLAQIFPWIEAEEAALDEWEHSLASGKLQIP